jgi:hypothetical protein
VVKFYEDPPKKRYEWWVFAALDASLRTTRLDNTCLNKYNAAYGKQDDWHRQAV